MNRGGLAAAGVVLPAERLRGRGGRYAPARCRCWPAPSTAIPRTRCMMVGVTGTNGKTTTTRMVAAILRAAGKRVGTIGTLGAELDGVAHPERTHHAGSRPAAGLLAQMRDGGADAVVMEVSSHALAQHRTDGIAFNAGIFTNLTQDHLDFHGTMDAYFEAKARLFAEYPVLYPAPGQDAVRRGHQCGGVGGQDLVTLARGDIITFTTADNPANLHAEEIDLAPNAVALRRGLRQRHEGDSAADHAARRRRFSGRQRAGRDRRGPAPGHSSGDHRQRSGRICRRCRAALRPSLPGSAASA